MAIHPDRWANIGLVYYGTGGHDDLRPDFGGKVLQTATLHGAPLHNAGPAIR